MQSALLELFAPQFINSCGVNLVTYENIVAFFYQMYYN